MFLALLLNIGVLGAYLTTRLLVREQIGSDLADVVAAAVPMLITAWLAPKVSYRRRDALFWITGLGGMWIFLIIAWRVAYLPFRDWRPRDEEIAHRVFPPGVGDKGIWILDDSATRIRPLHDA